LDASFSKSMGAPSFFSLFSLLSIVLTPGCGFSLTFGSISSPSGKNFPPFSFFSDVQSRPQIWLCSFRTITSRVCLWPPPFSPRPKRGACFENLKSTVAFRFSPCFLCDEVWLGPVSGFLFVYGLRSCATSLSPNRFLPVADFCCKKLSRSFCTP